MHSTIPSMARPGFSDSLTRRMVFCKSREPLQGVVLALHGDEDRVRGGERVQGQQPERRGQSMSTKS